MSNGIRDIETNARVTKLLCHPLGCQLLTQDGSTIVRRKKMMPSKFDQIFVEKVFGK